MESVPKQAPSRRSLAVVAGLFCAPLLLVWGFPMAWYTQSTPGQGYFWLLERTNIANWSYREAPVGESAEAVLVADRLVNGEFSNPEGRVVRVFSANRYEEKRNEIGLFVHTPDRCWTQAGWKFGACDPETVEMELHGVRVLFERRIFEGGGQRELVYFAGLAAGQPLPYRLDHNFSVGARHAATFGSREGGTALRATDSRLWTRVWDSFIHRRELFGPKQFLRISTPALPGLEGRADELLRSFLGQWLESADFAAEQRRWREKS